MRRWPTSCALLPLCWFVQYAAGNVRMIGDWPRRHPIVVLGRDGVYYAHAKCPPEKPSRWTTADGLEWHWAKCEQRVIDNAYVGDEVYVDENGRTTPIHRPLPAPTFEGAHDMVRFFALGEDTSPTAWRQRNAFGDVGARAEGRA